MALAQRPSTPPTLQRDEPLQGAQFGLAQLPRCSVDGDGKVSQ